MIQVDVDRQINHVRALYDKEWKKFDFSIGYPFNPTDISKPRNLQEMITVAERLSAEFDYLRVDLYSNDDDIKVGELTNCHGNALEKIISKNNNATRGELEFFGFKV